ncbi:hypothetical protein BC831DRAFT_414522 [Entophlyctis helioformis]|nr:hypothetical protein BC831DRAFT_414522 [Entophlyctis helioformis]
MDGKDDSWAADGTAVATEESQAVAQIHGVEKRLIQVLHLASQGLSVLASPNTDFEDTREAFETKCVNMAEIVTVGAGLPAPCKTHAAPGRSDRLRQEIQTGLRTLLHKFAVTGVLDAAGQQLEYNITTAGAEKDLEIMTNGIALLRDLLQDVAGTQHQSTEQPHQQHMDTDD